MDRRLAAAKASIRCSRGLRGLKCESRESEKEDGSAEMQCESVHVDHHLLRCVAFGAATRYRAPDDSLT